MKNSLLPGLGAATTKNDFAAKNTTASFNPQPLIRKASSLLFWGFALLFLLISGKSFGQIAPTTALSIPSTTTVTNTVGSYAGSAATLPSYWAESGTGTSGNTQSGTNQASGTSGGWYGSGNANAGGMSFLGSANASNGNGTICYQNNTGATITGFSISYTAKMFKNGTGSPTVSVSWATTGTIAAQTSGALANTLSSLNFSDATASISTGVTLSQTVSSISIANGQYIYVRWIHSGGSNSDNLGWNSINFTAATVATLTPPSLTAAAGATVDAPFNVTFTDANSWAANITGITVGGTALTAGYTVGTNTITFTPSASVPAGLLQTAATNKSIVVSATGFSTSTVAQTIGAGAANKLTMNTQPTAPATNGAVLAIQPKVNIVDQYGNATTSTASITAAVGAGTWTLGGTASVAAIAGTTTFAGLTATSAAAVTGATIAFSSTELTGVTSGTFNIPSPPPTNDLCANPAALTVNGGTVNGTTVSATYTTLTSEPYTAYSDVWYTFTTSSAGSFTITTSTTGVDYDLYVFSTCPSSATSYVTGGNAANSGTTSETLTFTATTGTTYLVRVVNTTSTAGSVFTIAVTGPAVFYSKSTGNLDVLANWGTNTDGTGNAPSNFTAANQTFNIRNNATPTIGAIWAVSGTSSKVVTGDGTNAVNFTIPSGFAFTGTIDVSAASTLTIANTTIPTLGTVAATSTVDYSGTSQTIAAVNYGNLSNSSNGTRTLASTGTIGVAGTYTPTSGTNTITGSTVNYNGTAAQTVAAATYNNLTVSNAAGCTTGGAVGLSAVLTVSQGLTVGDSSTLTINSTGSVTIASAKNLTINATGTIQNNSVTGFTVTGTMTVNGTYVHNANSNTLPSTNTTYATGSTIKVGDGGANITSTIPLIPASAYNVIWNCPNQTAGANFISATTININNLTISSTGTGFITDGFSTTARTLNIAGNLSVSGGNYYIVANNTTSATANQTTNVTGNVTVSGGQLGISYNTGGTGLGYLNVDGNILHTAGTFGNQSASTIGTLTCKGSVLQDIQTTGVSNNIALTINNASGVSLSTNMTVGGLLTLSSGSFSVGSNTLTLNGAAIAGTPANLSSSSSSSLSFGGSAGSIIIPSSVTALNNLTINNSNGVALNSSLVISGTLTFTSGNLTIGSNTLTLNGAVVNTSGTLTGSATSNLTIGGAAGTLNFTNGSRALNNLSLGASGSATLGTALDIYGVLGFTASGNLNMNAQAVTLKSTATATARVSDLTGSTLSGATNVTVERYIPNNRAWRALTAPLKGSSVDASIFSQWQNNGATVANTGVELWGPGGTGSAGNGLAVGPNSSMLQYVSGAWGGVTDTNATKLFTTNGNNAFMVFPTGPYNSGLISSAATPIATTLKATGQVITGDVPYTNLPSASHTLIGNPYASPLNLILMLTDTANLGFTGYIWVWDANTSGANAVGSYNLFNVVSGVGTYTNLFTNLAAAFDSGTQIQSGQAFFVLPTVNLSTFTIKETHKGSTFSNAVLRTAGLELLRVGLYKQVNTEWSGRDGAMTVITPDADANQMANKMANGSENVAFTKNAGLFASNHHLPLVASDVLNVKVWNTTAGTNYKLKIYTEEFTATYLDATLEDLFTNARTPLPLDGTAVEYPFSVTTDALSTGNRFRIVFQTSALGINNPKANAFSILPNPVTGDTFQVNLGMLATGTYSYTICNALGQEVEKGSINNAAQNTNYEVKMSNGAAGIYIMKIKGSDNSVFTAKIIKK